MQERARQLIEWYQCQRETTFLGGQSCYVADRNCSDEAQNAAARAAASLGFKTVSYAGFIHAEDIQQSGTRTTSGESEAEGHAAEAGENG